MIRTTLSRAAFVLLVSMTGTALAETPQPLETVTKVDLGRYIGKWYEVALFPNRFQAQCIADTTATYALKPDGRISVTNRCKLQDGKMDEAVGEAKLATDDGSNSKLKVRFAPAFLSWLPMVWGDYWIIELDFDYQYVVVSEPRREFLWILGRQPQLPEATIAGIRARLTSRGFDTTKLVFKPQSR
jgi:apolipoprotein D and lipocalin family protein